MLKCVRYSLIVVKEIFSYATRKEVIPGIAQKPLTDEERKRHAEDLAWFAATGVFGFGSRRKRKKEQQAN